VVKAKRYVEQSPEFGVSKKMIWKHWKRAVMIIDYKKFNSHVSRVLGLVVIAAISRAPLQAQVRSNHVEFDVASIKENRQDVPWQDNRDNCGLNGMGSVNILPGGRLIAERALLACIIQGAYGVRPYQVVGGPPWLNSIHFDIDAKAENRNASSEEMRTMLQTLLADRFKLRVHKETRNIPVYELSVAKGGTKLKPPVPGSCRRPGDAGSAGAPAPPAAGQPPAAIIFPCGKIGGVGSPKGSRLDGGAVAISELVRLLTLQLRRPVIDKTDLKGTFDIHLTYVGTGGLTTSPTDGGEASADFGLTIFDAIAKQLGLKLEPSRAPSTVFVVDSVQQPVKN
jgi:uncharacterized protein (TIGR03435 family)